VRRAWDDGSAFARLQAWVAAQDGRLDLDRDDFGLVTAPLATEITAPADGWLAGIDCRALGLALADMKGARRTVDDPLDLGCGLEFLPQVGDRLAKGDVIARVFCDRRDEAEAAAQRALAALSFSASAVAGRDLVMGKVR
ncbi:MAG TPA: hypothetical protein PLQ13_10585, partial [Candidatus Krumholzibacteria bacterium]|nr:hypothetical protein [Candidatus Krumholzibacteria bacterium]